MNGLPRRRRAWRLALRSGLLVVLLAATATLALALQVREVRVSGVHRFPAAAVEQALRSALGTPTLAARPEALRAAVRALPWVEDARVRVSLDGVVTCVVTERVPAAVAVDGSLRRLVDASGTILGPAAGEADLLEAVDFGAHPDDLSAALAGAAGLGERWGRPLRRIRRIGAGAVELTFADTPFPVLADLDRPASVTEARRVLTAWDREVGADPLRLDARVPGRVAVLPAPPPAAGEAS